MPRWATLPSGVPADHRGECDKCPVTGQFSDRGGGRGCGQGSQVVPLDQLVDGHPPVAGGGELAGPGAQQAPERVPGHGGDGPAEPVRVGRVVQQAGLQVAHHRGRASGPGSDDGYAARGGLAQHVAAGLLLAGVHQQVERGEGDGQVAGLEGAGELRPGQPRAQPVPLRAVADDDRADAGHAGELGQPAYAVPAVQAADVAHDDLRPVGGSGARPAGVQPRVAQLGREGGGVDARRPQPGRDPELGHPLDHPGRGDQHGVGPVGDLGAPVVRRQVHDGGLLDDQAGDPQPAGVLEHLAPEGAGRGHVDQVGRELHQRVARLGAGAVERTGAHHAAAAVGRETPPGREDPHLVAGVDEPVGDRLHGRRGPVHRRVEGLGGECDLHASTLGTRGERRTSAPVRERELSGQRVRRWRPAGSDDVHPSEVTARTEPTSHRAGAEPRSG